MSGNDCMVERVARAIYAREYEGTLGAAGTAERALFLAVARAAIEAMKLPTSEMVRAGAAITIEPSEMLYEQEIGHRAASQCHKAMIDAALKDSP